MKLSVKERIVLGNILPPEGDFRTMKTIMKLREDLLFNEQEVKALDFKVVAAGQDEAGNPRQQTTWNQEADTGAEIAIGELGAEVIVTVLKALDAQKKLTADHLPLWERFVEAK